MADAAVSPFFQQQPQNTKQQLNLDFFSFQSPSDILAPHPDLFESELDSSLAAFDDELQVHLFNIDNNDAYGFLRADTPTHGPPSTITHSSESAYDGRSEAFFTNPTNYSSSNYSFPLDLNFDAMDIANIPIDTSNFAPGDLDIGHPTTVDPSLVDSNPLANFQTAELTANNLSKKRSHAHDRSPSFSGFSDYGGSQSSSDYLHQVLGLDTMPPTRRVRRDILPTFPESPEESADDDPRKKHKCDVCNRSFARAFNLKTHMATHDPKREKPHVCKHFPCERSFSRKHDLGRHLVSIHNDYSLSPNRALAAKKKGMDKTVGVNRSSRAWCETCGKGWIGKQTECECDSGIFK